MNPMRALAMMPLVLCLSAPLHAAQGVDLTDQSVSPNFPAWTLLGSAAAANFTPGNGFTYSTMSLTQSTLGGQAGAGWAPEALTLNFNEPFTFRFLFNIQNSPLEIRGDGLSFVLATAPGLGTGGSGLGYEGLTSASVALAVDTFNFDEEPASPSLQILSGGSVTPLAATPTGLGDSIRNAKYAWVATLSYAPSDLGDDSGTLTGTIENLLLGSFSVTAGVDFVALGMSGLPIYYGFTASTGLATDAHNLQWGAPVPEPEAFLMMLAGLGAVGLVARRRASTRR